MATVVEGFFRVPVPKHVFVAGTWPAASATRALPVIGSATASTSQISHARC